MTLAAGSECVAWEWDAPHNEVENFVDDRRGYRESSGELHALSAGEEVEVIADDLAGDFAFEGFVFFELEQKALLDSACTDSGGLALFELGDDVFGVFDGAISAEGDFFDWFVEVAVIVDTADDELSSFAQIFGQLREELGAEIFVQRGF